MDWLDLLIVGIVAWMTFRAFSNGLIREAVTLLALLLGIVLAGAFYRQLSADIAFLIEDERARNLVAFLALLGGMVAADGGGPPHGRIFLVPRQDYQSVDTWQVAGLQGTGSWDVILDDVLVPAYRTQSMLDNFLLKGPGQAVNTASLYRLPFGLIFVRGISTAALGALQGMLNAMLDYGKTRVTRAGGHHRKIRSSSCSQPRRRRRSTR